MHEINLDLKSKKSDQSTLIADNTTIEIVIPWKEAHAAYQKALQRAASSVKVAGFRKGKLPLHITEQQVGRAYLIQQAINDLLPAKYSEAVKKSGKKVIAYPEFEPVSIEWEKDWKINAITAEEPEFKLGNYQKVIKDAQKEASKEIEKIEQEAKKSAEKQAKDKAKDKKDAKSKTDAEPAPKLPTMSDQAKKDKTLEAVIKALVTTIKPAVPEILVKQQAHNELHRLEDQLKNLNLDLQGYLTRRNITEEALLQELAAAALAQLQTDFVMIKLTEAEKLTVTDQEIEKQLGDKAGAANSQLKSMLRTSLQRQKLLDYLLA
jgi:FKBP-type peptidyl-prolyl cis-trans isomerase (trigger factor)